MNGNIYEMYKEAKELCEIGIKLAEAGKARCQELEESEKKLSRRYTEDKQKVCAYLERGGTVTVMDVGEYLQAGANLKNELEEKGE